MALATSWVPSDDGNDAVIATYIMCPPEIDKKAGAVWCVETIRTGRRTAPDLNTIHKCPREPQLQVLPLAAVSLEL